MKPILFSCTIFILFASCDRMVKKSAAIIHHMTTDSLPAYDSVKRMDSNREDATIVRDTLSAHAGKVIDTKNVHPAEVVRFAQTLIGVPYKYGSTNPSEGFDCSGFITYVFNHFGIAVPRSSIDFTHVGKEIPAEASKPGDLILFTGTNPEERFVGHMGIIVSNTDTVKFIHSTSGKAYGVTITPLNEYYKSRYIKTIRIFAQNG